MLSYKVTIPNKKIIDIAFDVKENKEFIFKNNRCEELNINALCKAYRFKRENDNILISESIDKWQVLDNDILNDLAFRCLIKDIEKISLSEDLRPEGTI